MTRFGDAKFGTILADPPWPSPQGKRNIPWMGHASNRTYSTPSMKEVLSLPVGEWANDNAVLVVWATWMHLDEAMSLFPNWGFRYCAGMPWVKTTKAGTPIYGPGIWFMGCSELILIGRRGKPFGSAGNPRPARKGIILAPRQEHSRKPEELAQWIEEKLPGPYLELFARRKRPGWTTWGDQCPDS